MLKLNLKFFSTICQKSATERTPIEPPPNMSSQYVQPNVYQRMRESLKYAGAPQCDIPSLFFCPFQGQVHCFSERTKFSQKHFKILKFRQNPLKTSKCQIGLNFSHTFSQIAKPCCFMRQIRTEEPVQNAELLPADLLPRALARRVQPFGLRDLLLHFLLPAGHRGAGFRIFCF